MVKSKNPSGRVNTLPHPKARADAAMADARSAGAAAEEESMPIFFYMPNELPYGVFCQWQKSWFNLPLSHFSYLNRNADLKQATRSAEEQLLSGLVSTSNAESSNSTESASPTKAATQSGAVEFQNQKEERITFNCAEQYMMYCKAVYFQDPSSAAKILASRDPKFQKQVGRQVRGYDEYKWDLIRAQVGEEGNYAKFSQDERLKRLLLGTGDRLLCEAAKRDDIWGIGMDAATGIATWNALGGGKAQKAWGSNLLGKSIMAARTRIREEEGRQVFGERFGFRD